MAVTENGDEVRKFLSPLSPNHDNPVKPVHAVLKEDDERDFHALGFSVVKDRHGAVLPATAFKVCRLYRGENVLAGYDVAFCERFVCSVARSCNSSIFVIQLIKDVWRCSF